MNISELDKNKTEQCIVNETIRLNNCKAILDKLKNEYKHKEYMYMVELSNIEDKITKLEGSIASGEKFLNDCNNHLKRFN